MAKSTYGHCPESTMCFANTKDNIVLRITLKYEDVVQDGHLGVVNLIQHLVESDFASRGGSLG